MNFFCVQSLIETDRSRREVYRGAGPRSFKCLGWNEVRWAEGTDWLQNMPPSLKLEYGKIRLGRKTECGAGWACRMLGR